MKLEFQEQTDDYINYTGIYNTESNPIEITVYRYNDSHDPQDIHVFADDKLVGKLTSYEVTELNESLGTAVEDLLWRANIGR